MNNLKKAIADFNKAIQLAPKEKVAFVFRARAYYKLKEYEKSILDLNEAIKLKPDEAVLYHLRGKNYSDLGDEMRAAADYAKAKDLGFNPPK